MSVINIQTKRVGDLSAITEVPEGSILLVHDGNGLKKISYEDLVGGKVSTLEKSVETLEDNVAPLIYSNAGAHNAIYRGKNLGTSVTSEQYAAIKAGTFDNLYIGDYWVINDVTYVIAAFDYYLQTGDTACTAHHAVIVPLVNMYNAQMNTTNTTAGGYVGSAMYTANLAQAKTTIKAAFNGHVLNHRILLTNAVTNGYASNGAWCDSEVDLMTEQMVYGGAVFTPACNGTTVPYNYKIEKSQLPLFAHRPDLISNRLTFWLRDVVTAAGFAIVNYYGSARYSNASGSDGVRPAFCIS